MTSVKDIAWVAGILEGEGCFRYKSGPIIQLSMTDEDVVRRARQILRHNATISVSRRSGIWKTTYQLGIYGYTAAQWMMTIYPLMGKRRQAKIRELLILWKAPKSRGQRMKKVA